MARELLKSVENLHDATNDVDNEINSLLEVIISELREISSEIDELESIESVEEVEDIKLSLTSKVEGLISDLY